MATGKRFNVRFRRRREGKTSYKKRLALAKSELPKLVVRRSNKYLIAQIVNYTENGDTTVAHFNSHSLKSKGWKHSCTNIPAGYLTGLAIASAAKKAKVAEAILDMGSYTPTKGCKVYAILKGAIDGGLKVSASEEALPSEERLNGVHINEKISSDLKKLKESI